MVQAQKAETPYLRKTLGYSRSAIRQAHNEKLKKCWVKSWNRSPRYQRTWFRDLLMPYLQKYLKYISNKKISTKTASLIFQLRVRHAPTNQYLHRFKKIVSPQCPACGHPKETVEHFLLHCPKYAHKRWPMLRNSRGGISKHSRLLSSPKLLIPLANYIESTRRFEQEQGGTPVSTTT